MGVFANAILNEQLKYKRTNKRDARFLILSDDNIKLLSHECMNDHKIKIESIFDSSSRKQIRRFIGLEIVNVKNSFQGTIGWGLGD